MKRVGFIDYYIGESHANNYPGWFKEICEKSGLDYGVAYVWAELDVSPVTGETTDEWCAKTGAVRCETMKELCEKSDVIVVLAPSNPEKHLGYAQAVLPYGKRTYIDKTFAPNLPTAQEIFKDPRHPYTIGLMNSKPVVGKKVDRLYSIPGKVPNPIDMPNYCYFKDRCEMCVEKCNGAYPCEVKLSDTHYVSCYRHYDDAVKEDK